MTIRNGRRALRLPWRWLLLAVLLVLPALASARTILVVGPHEDDETLLGAGRTRSAVLAGDTVYVALVTNGDLNGTAEGLLRQGESVAAAALLGVPEDHVIFLGYGDQFVETLWRASSGTTVYTSPAGRTSTYGNRGLGGMEFHRYLTGSPGPYNRNTFLADLQALITLAQPDEIYSVSRVDNHPDHAATAYFLNEALVGLKRSGAELNASLFESIVWAPEANGGCYGEWPPAGSGSLPYPPFPAPQCVTPGTALDWTMVLRFPVPADMQTATAATNLKWRAIEAYPSQFSDFLTAFVRKDEFFWRYDYPRNLALVAQLAASSDYPDGEGRLANAVDGYVDQDHEWKSLDDGGAWIQLTWPGPVRVAQVNLQDRIDVNDNVLTGTLSFSDGSSLAVGALPTGGKPLVLTFPPRTVTWIRFTIGSFRGSTPGLTEVAVLGVPDSFTGNVPPHVVRGPLPSTSSIDFTQTRELTLQAHDLDGDALQYTWSADMGSLVADGATAIFTPPVVGQSTVATITVEVSDGRGGVARNSAFVTVTAAHAAGLAVSPASVPAGIVARGTVLLSEAAPAGGVTVPLASSDPLVAAVPASVTVAAGGTSASFDVSTGTVAADTAVVITATFGGVNRTAGLTVTPPVPAALSLSPASVVGGYPVQATVVLSAPAPAGGRTLQLTSTDPSLAAVPASMTVPAGAASATFTVTTAVVGATRTATLAATDGVSVSTALLTVSPLRLASLGVAPTSVAGGTGATGTVTLNAAAPQGGAVVGLASSNPAVAAVPESVVIGAGSTSVQFPVTTAPVAGSTAVAITASCAGSTAAATLTVTPSALSALVLSPTSVTGGFEVAGTVTLTGPAPAGGATVVLSSSASAATVPASVSIAAGASAATFTIATRPVSSTTSVTISATLGAVKKTATLSVRALSASSVKLAPTSVMGGAPSTGTLTLSTAAPAGGLTVPLASGNIAAATVPASVLVPGGATTATFPVTTYPVTAQASVVISATYAVTRTATLTVKAPALTTWTLAPNSVVGGAGTVGTATLTGPAPQAGFTVTLRSSAVAATVPATVVVPAGATSATAAISTTPVAAVTSATLSAVAGSVTRNATLTVTASPASSSIALAPASLHSAGTSIATVTLNGPAPAGGTVVTLRSSRTAVATVPASVTVLQGATTATATVTARTVAYSSTSSISAVAGGVTRSATLTVAP